MQEEFLHYIWQHKMYKQNALYTEDGLSIEIIHPGEPNPNAGPDFFNAKIKIEETLWAGNVEIHKFASEWKEHRHYMDESYDNVILHVVDEVDAETISSAGRKIPVLKLNYSHDLHDNYIQLKNNKSWLACAEHLNNVSAFEISLWQQRMLVERLENKMKDVCRILNLTTQNWDETFYRMLFRSFGFGVNGDPFELLAQSIPLKVLLKYCSSQKKMEALLFGQAGFLDDFYEVEYLNVINREYQVLKEKHQLVPIENHLWKFLRLRPSNFPTIRISQLASLLLRLKGVFGQLINEPDIKKVDELLNVQVSAYWESHYTKSKESVKKEKKLGANSKKLIIINTIVPYLFAFGKITGAEEYEKRAFDWLSNLKPESNSIIERWKAHEISINNAGDSQALIYLSNNYCKPKKCLRCRIGHKVLAIKNSE